MIKGFSPKILRYFATASTAGLGIYLTVHRHRTQTVKDLLIGEGKDIPEDGDIQWRRKLQSKGIGELLEVVSEKSLKVKCRELLKIPLMDSKSFRGEEEARRWCVKEN